MNLIENINTEFKETFVAEIKKEVVAFANTEGGTIYIGIADNGKVIGTETPDKILLQAVNVIRDSIKPDVTLFTTCTVEEMEEKKIIKISVQRGVDRPYYLLEKGLKPAGVYVRQGSASAPASADAIRQMIKETDGDTYEQVRSLNQDLTFEYAAAEMKKRKLAFGQSQMKTLGLLGTDGLYSNLGLLLSDQCVHSVKSACFEGLDKRLFKDRREFHGSLLQQLNETYQYIDLFNKTNATFSGLERIDKRDYPPEAIREALLNAIVHREYAFSGSTLINIYDNRIEFLSLGGLVPGLSIEAIMLGISQSRNEKLANFFYRLKLIEAYGTGIVKILSSYQDSAVKPVIQATDGAFQVVLPNLNYSDESALKQPAAKGIDQHSILNQQFQSVLDYIREHGSITRSEAQNLLKVGQTRALNVLKEMVDAKILAAMGKGRKTKYQLI